MDSNISAILTDARKLLPYGVQSVESKPIPLGPLTGTLDEFDEFMKYNEFGLAFEAISIVGWKAKASIMFWEKLAQAEILMKIKGKINERCNQEDTD